MLSLGFTAAFTAALVLAFPGPSNLFPRSPCAGNTPSTRSQWCEYDSSTDYYTVAPDTGVVREYYFDLTDVVVAPYVKNFLSRSSCSFAGRQHA